jgi:hypothetical protein
LEAVYVSNATLRAQVIDPMKLKDRYWPDVTFYKQQEEIIYSVWENDETVVPAGNMLGKDFVAGFLVLAFFMSRHPCRVVTTSVKDDHLRVLWGEIGRYIRNAKKPLDSRLGGPLVVNHHELKKLVGGSLCPISYVKGMVAAEGAAMQGHHATADAGSPFSGVPLTLFVADEASGVPDEYYTMATTWAKRVLIIGNTWPCENFFKRAVKGDPITGQAGGDIPRPEGRGFYRKIITIKAEDSPNVRLALSQQRRGVSVTNETIVPGVKGYEEYTKNRALWNNVQQCVSLDAEFYEGAEVKMFPKEWLDASAARALGLAGMPRQAKSMGIDAGEGWADTSWAVCDELGLIRLIAEKTPDSSKIIPRTIALLKEYGIDPKNVLFDRGGGGFQYAGIMREMGYNVRTVAFGEPTSPVLKGRGVVPILPVRIEQAEERYTYVNRRAEMYGLLRRRMDPSIMGNLVFAIPRKYHELRRQLAPIPISYDGEGRMYLLPKNKKGKDDKRVTLTDLIGRSPDDADALVLAVYGLVNKARTFTVTMG